MECEGPANAFVGLGSQHLVQLREELREFEPLRSFYASFIAVDEDDVEVFRALLRQLYNDHIGSGYAYFLIGLHERDPLAPALDDYTLTPFAGRLFAVHYPDGAAVFESLDGRVPYVELAAL